MDKMTDKMKDINDDEIRIISSDSPKPLNDGRAKNGRGWILALSILVAACGVAACIWLFFSSSKISGETAAKHDNGVNHTATDNVAPSAGGYCSVRDTVVNGVSLTIIVPHDATPTLEVGGEIAADPSVVLAMQAADIREDNGGIVGSFVVAGNLVGKGESKAGFCSIIDNKITIGVADATPMLEQALTENGYFFRQYPLVVGGQIVENKPKGSALRKALAELDGEVCVILTNTPTTFHAFSEALVDVGVRNAIYLVGGSGFGVYVDGDGQHYSVGKCWDGEVENVNYIVWR